MRRVLRDELAKAEVALAEAEARVRELERKARPVFVFVTNDHQALRIYRDGRITGFPPGMVMTNEVRKLFGN